MLNVVPRGMNLVMVGMGRTPEAYLRTAPKGVRGEKTKLGGKWIVACDTSGRHILILSGKKIKGALRFVGYAPETHYIPTDDVERAGTHKAGKHWRHLHSDDGGKFPKVYADRNGKLDKDSNLVYAKGTYSVTDWIRR